MFQRLTVLAILAFALAFLAAKIIKQGDLKYVSDISKRIEFKNRTAIGCGTNWAIVNELIEETDIPIIPGSGNHTWKISTKNDCAQRYFNQGINMYYSFHIIEAMASFKKAIKFDPDCAMLYWAQALTYGPNINDLGYIASPDALKATGMAVQLSGKASDLEKALINAMAVRYTADSADATRKKLNEAYTAMMKKAYESFKSSDDAQALYADAMMLEHPWDLWNINGTPKPWTPLIEKVLEHLLVKNPAHPGANHYYIHVMEPSPYAAKALPSANRLGKLTPALSHTVHMPSHIYLRTGNYNAGISVNQNAVKSYNKVVGFYGPASGGDFLYVIHNLHMQTNVAMLAGRSAFSLQSANETKNSIPADYLNSPAPMGSAVQYIYMIPTLVNIRFGNWNELLSAKEPDQKQIYATVLFHFGKGMAMAHQANTTAAKSELVLMQEIMKDSGLFIPFGTFSPAIDGARVAENLLAGSISMTEKDYKKAIEFFNKAATIEENMVYTEPRDWLLNPKHYLANAYLQNRNFKEAEAVLKKDLQNNNENGWALFGVYQSLLAQQKRSAAAAILFRFKKAFGQADIKLSGPVF